MGGSNDMELSDFRNLFKGSANLGLLLGSFSLDWTKVAPFVADFASELNQEQELGLRSDGGAITLGTRGDGQEFVHRVARFMESNGVAEEALKQFLIRSAFMNYQNVFFSIEIGHGDRPRFNYVLRHGQPLDVGVAMLVDAGVGAAGLALTRDVGRFLEKENIHGFWVSLLPDGNDFQVPIFSQPRDPGSWSRLVRAGEACGLADSLATLSAAKPLVNHGAMAGPAYGLGRDAPDLLLILRGVNDSELGLLELDPAALERVQGFLRICGKKSLSAIQIYFSNDGVCSMNFICA